MQLNFISAKSALRKDLIKGENYPNVTKVTSHGHEIQSLAELYEIIKKEARAGNAIITNGLKKTLVDESRAGMSLSDPTELFILDVDTDFLPFATREDMVEALGLDADFVFQHSASSPSPESLRGHYFFLLEKPESTVRIKRVVRWLNNEHLRVYIALNNAKRGLKWPLDIGINDPGRLVYIAPPRIEIDPIDNRIVPAQGERRLTLPEVQEVNTTDIINNLRVAVGEEKIEEAQILAVKPGEFKITGQRENDEFIYLNLNGGDSWGYYIIKEYPALIRNFKDEPDIPLKDVDPALAARLKRDLPSGDDLVPNADSITHMGFRDPEADLYYQVEYKGETWTKYHITNSKDRLNDYLVTKGLEKLKAVPDGTVFFDPTSEVSFDPEKRILNLYRPTPHMVSTETSEEMPEHIEKVIRHLLVTEECYERFINWLAFIVQKKEKTGTAWILQGHTGTGKGTLYSEILVPLFGYEHCHTGTIELISESYNSFLRKNIILVVDEFNINDIDNSNRVWNKLKTYITETQLPIRAMRTEQVLAENFSNLIFTTNEDDILNIDHSERRLNIPPRQEQPHINLHKFRHKLKHEVGAFANYLRGYKVNEFHARTVIKTDARLQAIEASRSSVQTIFDAIKQGDLDFFIENLLERPPADVNTFLTYSRYKEIVAGWMNRRGEEELITNEELLDVYQYLQPHNKVAMVKFGAICRKNGMQLSRKRIDGRQLRCFVTKFESDSTYEPKQEPDNVIPILR